MSKQEPWFLEERAVAFASLALTKHSNVVVRAQTGSDRRIDLLIEVLRDGRSTLRYFGVQLLPFLDLPAPEQINAHVSKEPLDSSLPLCMFAIGVRNPEGVGAWLATPTIDEAGPHLRWESEPVWHPLDDALVASLIQQVNRWYEAKIGAAGKTSRGRQLKPVT